METIHRIGRKRRSTKNILYAIVILAFLLGALSLPALHVVAANPPPVQLYYVSLPEDDLLQLFDDDDAAGGTFPDPVSPIRSITGIAISTSGTLIYYDQWEDGGYDTDISNPGANTYDASTNPDGTQIWGDGVLTNGCPPSINNVINPCAAASDDQLSSGQVIILDNDVAISGTSPGPYSRNSSLIFYDGRDKFGSTTAVAVTRGAFPLSPGSVMAGGTEVIDTTRWGSSYRAPLGDNLPAGQTSAFEDVRWFIMAGAGGATIDVDANGDGDLVDTDDLNDFAMAEGAKKYVDGIKVNATLTVVSGNPVQVNSMTADVDDTFEFRWDALLPRPAWSNSYYSPVGTALKASNSGCTEVWIHNPNAASITVTIDRPGGVSTTRTVGANSTVDWPTAATDLYDEGFHMYTTGGQVFLPIQIVDCTKDTSSTDGRLYDWGNPLFPENQLTNEVLVGWAPGCTNESHSGICHDPDSDPGGTTPDVTTTGSRSVVWVTPLANTTIYIDKNGSGITCPGGGGAEQTISATALTSYRINNDPTTRVYVHDNFGSQNYSRDDSVDGWSGNQTWTTDWTETGETTSPTAGAIFIDGTALALRLRDSGTETGISIQRSHNTSGNIYARLSFQLSGSGLDAGEDRIAVEVSGNGGSTWSTLKTYDGPWSGTTNEIFNISPYIATNTTVRFRFIDNLETSEYWQIDHVHIDYANNGDFDMTSSLIKTCDGTLIAAAYGQDPALSGGNDDEALDLGTGIAPFRTEIRRGAIGNYVWVDEDGDGVQDAGESGIPNVKVTVTGTDRDGNSISLTTYTDANGGYLFTNLLPPQVNTTYTVTVDSTTLPAGLAANPTYDENGTGTPHTTSVNLLAGEEHLTADFGYNWAPTSDVTNNTGTGAIGDRVWIDTDGDGVQDTNEAGLGGVNVQLITAGADGLFGTGDDVVAATTTTNDNGNYIFDGLAAGSYVVKIPTTPSGYSQTGDPDATLDNQTTDPIILAPGDVFLNADFGYQPTGTTGTIGDLVWLDADRDNTKDATEKGIPNVMVSLIKDSNGNGQWDAGEPIIATDITDENGLYLFSGLPVDNDANSDYLVWVNDPQDVLAGVVPTYDSDGTAPASGVKTGLGISAVNITTASPSNLNQDFAYAPSGHDATEGLIGDTIFLDRDGDGAFDPGEGLEGVLVEVLDSNGRLIGAAFTDENGNYWVGGLAAGTYTVRVVTTTLPNGGAGLTNTVDPDTASPGNSQSSVTIGAGGINLDQDFGYRPTGTDPVNSISGTIWDDRDSDGTLEGGETGRFQNVTVGLFSDTNGNGVLDGNDSLVGTTSTDGSGNYSFNNLPNGTYFVDVIDDNNVLNGLWKSNGTNPGVDNNSQNDPYKVTLSGGQNNTTADFGYYDMPASLGDFVWEDLDGDGLQDVGEPGIGGVEVTLTITWPGGAGTTTLKTITANDGSYSFENLLTDENMDGVGGSEPTFQVSVVTPTGMTAAPANVGGNDAIDSDGSPTSAIVTKGANDPTYDFGFIRPNAIGNKVWLDEDSDGLQDPGEAGIANVTVELWNAGHTAILATTTTDADGNYIFKNLGAGTYQVDVLNTSLPAGLVQSIPTGTGDFTNKTDPYTVTLTSGTENLTADFGYNWAPTSDVTGNTGTGAIGDRVWIDADGDGVQDPEELGLRGVTVQLVTAGPDGLFGTGDDVVAATTTTNATGNYIFDGLAAGSYVVKIPTIPTGYTQTGDPDQLGVPCTACDNQTTAPISLSPGDVFVNADFGYRPDTGVGAPIGDRVWLDADTDGVQDGNENGIPGVTVALIRDTNADGSWDPDGLDNILGTPDDETILATDITDATGIYTFPGVPTTDGLGTDDYLVWVNDTNNVLAGLSPTFDSNGTGTPNISAVPNLTPAGDLAQDFGYAPAGQAPGEGLIGDTIYLDRDSGLDYDIGEGLEGVVVRLYDSTGTTLLATTATDENGNYYFANLPAGTYTVKVDTTTLPGGLTNTVDPDGGGNNQSVVTIGGAQPIVNLNQDFGYDGGGSIGNLVWNDSDGDGFKDASETGISGVTVDLYWDSNANGVLDPADKIVGTTTTDGSGAYTFANLGTDDGGGNINYFVHVSDTANVLNGYWHSLGANGVDNNSQADPYLVSLTPGSPTNNTADFGYYIKPSSVGNRVWYDTDGDGIQDGGEGGLIVEVTLKITYPDGTVVNLKTKTDSNGEYRFDNLLLDEQYDGNGTPGAGGNEPKYEIIVNTPSGFTSSPANIGPENNDSDGLPAGATGGTPVIAEVGANGNPILVLGTFVPDFDFGFKPSPTNVFVASFNAAFIDASSVKVQWLTTMEIDVVGYRIYRSTSPNDPGTPISGMIPAFGAGGSYEYLDTTAQAGVTYYYWLYVITAPNNTESAVEIPPAMAVYAPERTFLPFVRRR